MLRLYAGRARRAAGILPAMNHWTFVLAAYALVFGLVIRPRTTQDGLTYALFIASGILPWSALREGLESSAATLPDNRWIRFAPGDPLAKRGRAISKAAEPRGGRAGHSFDLLALPGSRFRQFFSSAGGYARNRIP